MYDKKQNCTLKSDNVRSAEQVVTFGAFRLKLMVCFHQLSLGSDFCIAHWNETNLYIETIPSNV